MKRKEELEKLLVVVDMVNGFVKEGAMADKKIQEIIPEIKKLIDVIKKEGEGIAFIKDTHKKECREFKRYPEHCVENTTEAEVVKELKEYEKESYSYQKNSTSTMFAKNFLNDIDAMKSLREVIITGCCTDICVMNLAIPLQNYFDEQDRDVDIIVPESAVATYNAPWHDRETYEKAALQFMNQAGIQLVKTYKGGK